MEQEQHPIFVKYRRAWLHKMTGYSQGYLCRVATGKVRASRSFIERMAYSLKQPANELFNSSHGDD